jgi:hypothetical protein
MHGILKRSISLAAAAMIMTGVALPVAAQDDGEDGATAAIPMPEECLVEPRDQAEIDEILASSQPSAPLADGLPVPLGTPADEETQTAVKEVVREFIACLNGNDAARAAALVTDSGMVGFYGPAAADDSADVQAPEGTPVARPDDALLRLRAVTDISVLDDGRLGAFVLLNDPLVRGGGQTLMFIFADDGEGPAIDAVLGFSVVVPAGATSAATPAP